VVAAGGLLALAWCDAVSVVVGTTVAPIPFSAKRMFERHAHFFSILSVPGGRHRTDVRSNSCLSRAGGGGLLDEQGVGEHGR
jgi:hypothetical protein